MRIRAKLATAAVITAGLAGTLLAASPAQAVDKFYACGGLLDADYCLYYNSYQSGACVSAYEPVPNWGPDSSDGNLPWIFSDCGTGTNGNNTPVKNNAASYTNSNDSKTGISYYNSYYAGASDWGGPRTYNGLVYTYNENASFRWA